MISIDEALNRLRQEHDATFTAAVERYVREGGGERLSAIQPPAADTTWSDPLVATLAKEAPADEPSRRVLRVLVVGRARRGLGEWISSAIFREAPGQDLFTPLAQAVRDAGALFDFVARLTAEFVSPLDTVAGPSSAGRWLLGMEPGPLAQALKETVYHEGVVRSLGLLARHGDESQRRLAASVLLRLPPFLSSVADAVLKERGPELAPFLAAALDTPTDDVRGALLVARATLRPGESPADRERLLAFSRKMFQAGATFDLEGVQWLFEKLGADILDDAVAFIARKGGRASDKAHLLAAGLSTLGQEASSALLEAAAASGDPLVAQRAVDVLCAKIPSEPRPPLDRLVALRLRSRGGSFSHDATRFLSAGPLWAPVVAEAWRSVPKSAHGRLGVGLRVAQFDTTIRDEVRDDVRRFLNEATQDVLPSDAPLIAKLFGRELLTDALHFMSHRDCQGCRQHLTNGYVAMLSADALPIVLALLEGGDAESKAQALEHLVTFGGTIGRDRLVKELVSALESEDGKVLTRVIPIAGRTLPEPRIAERLFELLGHKAESVRGAAVKALTTLGEPAFEKALPLVDGAKEPVVRASAIRLLSARNRPSDLRLFQERLGVEVGDAPRDALWEALAARPWPFPDPVMTDELLNRVIETAGSVKRPTPPKWVPEELLPALHWDDGRELTRNETRYLIGRFARRKDVEPDPEVQVLARRLASGPRAAFAAKLFEAFRGTGPDSKNRWALALAAAFGGDDLVPELTEMIVKTAEGGRSKLAENGVRALALLPGDAPLLALDGLSRKSRGRLKNVALRAGVVFQEAAARRGVSPDDLGDLVVPRLGFPPTGPLVLEEKVEVTVSPAFTFSFREIATKKRTDKPPRGLSTETKATLKTVAKELKEAAKVQTVRMETFLIDQRRWRAGRYRELFLEHPVLFPFAVRLVWGVYDDAGSLVQAFRALPDRTLTTADDDETELPEIGQIGIVHPIELSQEAGAGWLAHLADAEIAQPFPQMARPVARPSESELSLRELTFAKGRQVHAMGFRSRAEKLGWHPVSVEDDGTVPGLARPFPAAGLLAVLEADGVYMGYGGDEKATLGTLTFRRAAGTEPIAIAEVPPVVFSEAVGNVAAFGGS